MSTISVDMFVCICLLTFGYISAKKCLVEIISMTNDHIRIPSEWDGISMHQITYDVYDFYFYFLPLIHITYLQNEFRWRKREEKKRNTKKNPLCMGIFSIFTVFCCCCFYLTLLLSFRLSTGIKMLINMK